MAYNRKLLYTKSFPSWNTPEGDLGVVSQNGSPITPIQLVATELNEPGSTITYAVTAGALPTGLTLSTSGEISGTLTGYTDNGIVYFSLTATDNEGESVSRDFYIKIQGFPVFADYVILAGGAGGGSRFGGGGGAGGYLSLTNQSLTVGVTYTVTVGAGGAGGDLSSFFGGNGGNSVFNGSTAIGGGGGASYGAGQGAQSTGLSGGSGGGGASSEQSTFYPGGSGTSGQGLSGGSGYARTPYTSGGGGGFNSSGQNATTSKGGDGGAGVSSNITGSAVLMAAGGGGGSYRSSNGSLKGIGGSGIGGDGGDYTNVPGTAAVIHTGSGGGGGGYPDGFGGAGSSGLVIIRMQTAAYSGLTTGNPTVTTDGSDTILTYTGSGTYTA